MFLTQEQINRLFIAQGEERFRVQITSDCSVMYSAKLKCQILLDRGPKLNLYLAIYTYVVPYLIKML